MSKEQTRNKFKWRWSELLHPFLLRQRYLDWKFYTTLADALDNSTLRPGFMQQVLKSLKEDEAKAKAELVDRRNQNPGPYEFSRTNYTLSNHNKVLRNLKGYLTHWNIKYGMPTSNTLILCFNHIDRAKEQFDFEGDLKSLAFFIVDDLIDLAAPKATTYEVEFKEARDDWRYIEFDIIKSSTRTFDPID